MKKAPRNDPMTGVLARFRDQERTTFADAWVGLEPTFQTAKSVRKWEAMSSRPEGEEAHFKSSYMLKTQKKVARTIRERYETQLRKGRSHCMFARVELDEEPDAWNERRQNVRFHWADDNLEPLQVRFGLDPETFEYSVKPVPLAWFYEERFVAFLEEFLWKTPQDLGLSCSIAHGGAQFSLSAKTFLQGSLLADDIAYKINHPELATWIMDWPNLNRLQIAGELHVKSGQVLEAERVPALDAPLQLSMLTTESNWENRAQMGRTSARDYAEALLLAVHHAQYLQKHPHVAVTGSLHQDLILGDAELTLKRRGAATLARLRRRALKLNAEASRGRFKSDWVEPETLFWEAWRALRAGEKAAIAREAITGFLEHVGQAAVMDPRPGATEDPMEWHRHRIHPLLWEALSTSPGRPAARDPVHKELRAWQERRGEYLARRPQWSPVAGSRPPWRTRS